MIIEEPASVTPPTALMSTESTENRLTDTVSRVVSVVPGF